MDDITGYLEMASLNLEIASAYLKDAEGEIASVMEDLENCLILITKLRYHCWVAKYGLN